MYKRKLKRLLKLYATLKYEDNREVMKIYKHEGKLAILLIDKTNNKQSFYHNPTENMLESISEAIDKLIKECTTLKIDKNREDI